MGSTRLPGKVLAPIVGRPLLEHIVRRVKGARLLDALVIATTDRVEDDAVVALADRIGTACFRGSELDVLDRFYRAAQLHQAEIVLRLTGDNPLVDAALVDRCIGEFVNGQSPIAYLDTTSSRTFPLGLSVEVFTFAALEAAWREERDVLKRENVTPFIRERPERFRALKLESERVAADLRWTVDTPDDLAMMCALFAGAGIAERDVSTEEVLSYVRAHPELARMNSHVVQRT